MSGAPQSRRWHGMENKHAVQHYSKERFKVNCGFVMPCPALKFSS